MEDRAGRDDGSRRAGEPDGYCGEAENYPAHGVPGKENQMENISQGEMTSFAVSFLVRMNN